MKPKKNMTRDEAAQLYKDLKKTMSSMKQTQAKKAPAKPTPAASSGVDAKAIAASISAALRRDEPAGGSTSVASVAASIESERPRSLNKGQYTAICFVMMFASAKVFISGMESLGLASATPAEASYVSAPRVSMPTEQAGFSREDMKILTALDSRRSELEDRNKRLDERQSDLDKRDREFATRLTQLRDLTEKLSVERDKNEKKRSGQLEQLANVYGSMNPPEAAALIEQLDVQIALSLLERMPEKRIGQILALMSPERALSITKMLSGRAG